MNNEMDSEAARDLLLYQQFESTMLGNPLFALQTVDTQLCDLEACYERLRATVPESAPLLTDNLQEPDSEDFTLVGWVSLVGLLLLIILAVIKGG